MKRILLNPNPSRDIGLECTKRVADFFRENGAEVYLPDNVEGAEQSGLPIKEFKDAVESADMIVTFGGDGTILHTAVWAAEHDLPILGINIGRIGYMAELEANEIDYLKKVIDGMYVVDERMMLDVAVSREGEVVYSATALNDVVVLKNGGLRAADMDIYADDMFISHYSGDGVIVATPTGSTAYSLSAGGPIIDPLSRNITITPVCTHALTAKPIVLSFRRIINIVPQNLQNSAIAVSVDGASGFELRHGDKLTIKISDKVTKLIQVKNTNFYDVLYTKLSDRRFD